MTVKPITNEEREHCRKFPEYSHPDITKYEARLQQLEAALKEIRGWREIGSAVTDYERAQAMERIADRALNGDGE